MANRLRMWPIQYNNLQKVDDNDIASGMCMLASTARDGLFWVAIGLGYGVATNLDSSTNTTATVTTVVEVVGGFLGEWLHVNRTINIC